MITNEILFIIDENKKQLFDGNRFTDAPVKSTSDYFNATILPSPLIRTHGFKALKNTTPEKLEVQAEMKMYDEAGLDPDTEFKISYQKIDLENDENLYVETYASELSKIEEVFAPIVKKESHIDFLFPSFMSYVALYNFEKLDKKNDVFIHFGDDDSYAVIFKAGNYISTRSLPTLKELSHKIGLDLDKLKEVLKNKGLDKDLYSFEELYSINIEDELIKVVDRVIQAVVHKSGIFKIEGIDRIYLDFEGSDIPKFLDAFNDRGYEGVEKNILNIFEDVEVGMKHLALNALYALGCADEKYELLNFSIYDRKPSFFKTNVGQFSAVMFLSFVLAGIYPLYAYYQLEDLTKQENQLNNEVKKMQKITKKLKVKLKEQRNQKEQLKKDAIRSLNQIKSYDKMLNVLDSFDKETIVRQQMMKDINIAMKKYKLSSKHLIFKDRNTIVVHIVTQYYKRDNIALFINDLLDVGYSHVMTRKIEKSDNYYESYVEIRP